MIIGRPAPGCQSARDERPKNGTSDAPASGRRRAGLAAEEIFYEAAGVAERGIRSA